ncbi:hypothetical protein CP981_10880 [Streptomyces platensis]|uniref:Uncharacterized protein n=1 Tax=Streptomyces platensis TaxID=58346 RepID=A0AAE6NHP0_STRPT|nr:hypothetical protein [Streptomyces platensis]OSY44983.1 hypothetical protein BG653_03583 [Streptomyces platensis]QEV52103.1 hypothetical protein CP981_10880 [Streptomyces platensis]
MHPSSPRGRLRDALLRVGERGDVNEADLSAAVTTALRELASEALGERSRVDLVTLGAEDHPWGRSLGLRLADYDVELPRVLLSADRSALPPQVQESCPTLRQEEWETVLLLSKLLLMALQSEPEPVRDGAAHPPQSTPRPPRSVAREQFCQALADIPERPDRHPDELTGQLRTALLNFASETPDNKESARRIAVLHTGEPPQGPRLSLSRSGPALTKAVLSAAGCPVPSCVREEFPDLTQDEWTAVIQVTGLTLMAFEADPPRETE